MVVMVRNTNSGGGPQGEFQRPGGARYEPGSATHDLVPNRNAQVTVEVGPPMIPIESVAERRNDSHLQGTRNPGGEVVLGTNVVVPPRANDGWLNGQTIPSYDGPLQMMNNSEFGRNVDDAFAGQQVPRWYPSFPGDTPVEDRSNG